MVELLLLKRLSQERTTAAVAAVVITIEETITETDINHFLYCFSYSFLEGTKKDLELTQGLFLFILMKYLFYITPFSFA